MLATQASWSSGGLMIYKYDGKFYRNVGCYGYSWTTENDPDRRLKEPILSLCPYYDYE